MAYFVIEFESVRMLTFEQLREEIQERLDEGEPYTFLSSITEDDPSYWPEGSRLIIKGEIIVPTPCRVVTQYKIP